MKKIRLLLMFITCSMVSYAQYDESFFLNLQNRFMNDRIRWNQELQQLQALTIQQYYFQLQSEYAQYRRNGGTMTIKEFEAYRNQLLAPEKQTRPTYHRCRVCDGTGYEISEPYLGGTNRKWCNICGRSVYISHKHKPCTTCDATGKIRN